MNEISSIIDKNYSLDNLKKLYKTFLQELDQQTREQRLDQTYISHNEQKNQKQELVNLFTDILENEQKIKQLKSFLPADVLKTLYFFVWEGGIHKVENLEKKLEINIFYQEKEKSKIISPEFMLFCFQKNRTYESGIQFSIFFPEELRKKFKSLFTPPDEYFILPATPPAEDDFFCSEEERIADYLPIYLKFISGVMKTSKDNRPTKGSLKQFQEYANIQEFFPGDSEIEYLKSDLLLNLLKSFPLKKNYEDPLSLLVDVFENYFQNTDFFAEDFFLNGIKGKNQMEITEKTRIKINQSILSIIKELKENEWVDFENIYRFVLYRDIDLELYDRELAEKNLYIDQQSGRNQTNFQKLMITQDLYNELIYAPLLKGFFFLFSAFGIIDISYSYPSNNFYKQRGKEFLSFFDGLKKIRLNKLGAYLTGKIENYQPETKKQEFDLILSEYSLNITLNNKDKFSELYLEGFAEKNSEGIFQVSKNSFLKNCNDLGELENKIELFISKTEQEIPRIWLDFFTELKKNVQAIKPLPEYQIFQIEENDANLIKAINEDPLLEKVILKAEGYKIIIRINDLETIREQLRKYGYLL